jgi:YD repeat-containing protein
VKNRILRGFATVLLIAVFTTSPLSTVAQQGGTTTYVYDANGRLHAVISPTGEAAVYEYDAAGNITAIRRLAANVLSILSFSPHEGLPGDVVTFIGVGFGGGVTNVSFNGAPATVVSVINSKVVATVPAAATTGLVTITTPTGSATTAEPFTIAGVRITPSFAALKFGETVQFAAEVLPATLDQAVQWSVDGVVGGNANVGTISATGLYTAGNTRFSALTIRATSVADNARVGDALVRVSDPNDTQSVFAASVTVQRGDTISVASSAAPVSVRYNAVTENQAASAVPVAVQYGVDGGQRAALSAKVSVQRGDTVQAGGFSNPISVLKKSPVQYSAQTFVSSTMGPYIHSVSPAIITRGTTITLTINGPGLTGTSTLRFVTAASGAIDTAFVVSNITVNGDGTSLTATVTVNSTATLGNHIVVVATPVGDSIGIDLGVNIFNVVP